MTSLPPAPKPPRRSIANADVPSETAMQGLPDVGEGASAVHFARDSVDLQAEDGESPNETAKDADEVRGID
jgi:hypothetical protein